MTNVLVNNRTASNSVSGSTHTTQVQTLYTRRADDTGWLGVKLEPNGPVVFICEYTKVTLTKKINGRTYFRIAEGNGEYVGREASLKDENAAKFLKTGGLSGPATVQVKYAGKPERVRSEIRGDTNLQQWAVATFNGNTANVTLNSVWGHGYTPIPVGRHKIMAPDYSHANIPTSGYRAAHPDQIRCTDVWFPIALQGTTTNSSRYIHIGHLSEGCVTFYELLKWNAIYDYLINKRERGNNGKLIGDLIVTA